MFEDILREYVGGTFLETPIGDNLAVDYLSSAIVFILSLIVLRTFKFIILARLKAIAKQTENDYDDVIVKVVDSFGWLFYILLSLWISLEFIVVEQVISDFVYYAVLILTGFYVIRAAGILIDFTSRKILDHRKDKVDKSVVNLLVQLSKLSLWVIVSLAIVSNLGYDVSALLTGLGIGGIAIALALQTVLSDIFAYFSIHLDKPFKVGDFIIIGADMGTVEKIGVKTTRIRTLQGQELIVSNQELTSSRINNYKRMKERRIVFTFGVDLNTPNEKLEKIPVYVKKAIENSKFTRFDRAHFARFEDYRLLYEVVYFLDTPDFNQYMDTQQNINLELKSILEKEKIKIPYPTKIVHLMK